MPNNTTTDDSATTSLAAPRQQRRPTRYARPTEIDRSQPCNNRNGFWPPIYERQYDPLPPRSLDRNAQHRYARHLQDAVAKGEMHRTTADVIMVFWRRSDNYLEDVWCSQAYVAESLGLDEDTVNHHVAIAKQLGWLLVQHRNRISRGEWHAMSNITRLTLPPQWQAVDDAIRSSSIRKAAAASADRRRGRPRQGGRHLPGEERRPQPKYVEREERHVPEAGELERGVAAKLWAQYDGDYQRCVDAVERHFAGDPNAVNQALERLNELHHERPG